MITYKLPEVNRKVTILTLLVPCLANIAPLELEGLIHPQIVKVGAKIILLAAMVIYELPAK